MSIAQSAKGYLAAAAILQLSFAS